MSGGLVECRLWRIPSSICFLTQQLNELGYLVVAIGHELLKDPPLSVTGDLYETGSENWQRGAVTLEFIWKTLKLSYQNYDFEHLLLIGHSNGGDIAYWLANENKSYIVSLITLDHRGCLCLVRILSIRASDFPADKGGFRTVKRRWFMVW